MKCNITIINEFFKTNPDQEIKDFVSSLLKNFSDADGSNVEDVESALYFHQLGFFSLETDDKDDLTSSEYQDAVIIDFVSLSKLEIEFKKFMITLLNKYYENEISDFGELLTNGVLIKYSDWEKTNRKQKLKKLSKC